MRIVKAALWIIINLAILAGLSYLAFMLAFRLVIPTDKQAIYFLASLIVCGLFYRLCHTNFVVLYVCMFAGAIAVLHRIPAEVFLITGNLAVASVIHMMINMTPLMRHLQCANSRPKEVRPDDCRVL